MYDIFYATGGANTAIEAIIRFQSVKRWHMIDTTRQQTLAEHSANVAMLAGYISLTCPDMYFGEHSRVAAAALTHDLAEVFIGDIPTPTKKYISGVKELERTILPGEFKFMETSNPDIGLLVKLCDLADGIRFMTAYGIGTTAEHAKKGLAHQFENKSAEAMGRWPLSVHHHVVTYLETYAIL